MKIAMRVLVSACAFALAVALSGCSSTGSASSAASSSSGASATPSAEASATTESNASAEAAASSAAVGAASSTSAASSEASAASSGALAKGEYSVDVDTGSSMFHVNEANNGKGTLTVTDDGMTLHISLASKKITKLYAGTAEQAQADSAGVIDPTTDKVTYSDGAEEEVYGFDIPVPALDQAFDVAILGSKGNWYDHKVTVSNPVSE